MSKRATFSTLIITICAAGLAMAQTPAPSSQSTTPSGCLKASRDNWQTVLKDAQTRARASGKPLTAGENKALTEGRIAFAKACAAKFSVESLPATELAALAELHVEASELDLAKDVIARAIAATRGDVPARATTLATAVRIAMRQPRLPGVLDQAEQYVTELDALPDTFVRQQLEAHGVLNGYYRADDIDAGIIKHSTRILDLNKKLTAEQRVTPLTNTLLAAYQNLAEAWAGQERTPEALDVLRRAPAELAGMTGVDARLAPTLQRYELVGKPGSPVEAPRWLNTTPAGGKLDPKGQVTWVQFTAHWCGPCRESYPGVARLQQRFGAQGFRVVMATQMYGFFESRRNLADADEWAAISEYFPKHGVVFPVAVSDNIPTAMENGQPVRNVNINDANYKVGGIPQIQILDKKGIVRMIMVGYDEANEERLAALIARLLAEPVQ